MKPFVFFFSVGVLLVSVVVAGADAVSSTQMPLGAVEVTGSTGDGAHVLRLDAGGNLIALG